MAENKTKRNDASVDDFIQSVPDEKKRADARTLIDIMRQVTKAEPQMWGDSIVGFGSQHLKYESGRELDWFLAGFSPRKQNLVLYLMGGYEQYPELLKTLGKHKLGRACLYLNRLDDVHLPTLRKLIQRSVKDYAKHQAKTS
jgi:hypothetical protein